MATAAPTESERAAQAPQLRRALRAHHLFALAFGTIVGMINNERGRRIIASYAEKLGVPYETMLADHLRYSSMHRLIDPEEVAAMCLHLASPAGAHVSGQLIGICGNAEWE